MTMWKQSDDLALVNVASNASTLGSELAFALTSLKAAERLAREGAE